MKNINLQINPIPLSKLSVGAIAKVSDLLISGLSRRRMLDLGLVPGTIIEVIRKSPLGDPIAYNIRGATIALRKEEASQILVKPM
ncbi:ferrous iron transport protein A [Crassaminicella thermophila]|uniref:Ferrous iron transport protein A n=1 Tax=Crassaminicella thermophila TaxID=2599308 RepID=A0A5C0SEH4_CRATE|nr:FeoA family protein [Crassaminicella thermophila]QEK12833.1 ferrous iron transport protein A [Crassaminicella thermophila]